MARIYLLAACTLSVFATAANAQEWAAKMFTVRNHEFGTVAKGAKSEFQFEVTNPYVEDVHISSVRTSCGCTTPSITKNTLKTWEKGAVLAVFNTHTFLGQRGATLTVTIDKPFFAEVQLKVSGLIRSDVMFTPSFVDFGNVDHGVAAERRVSVNYTGRSTWKINDVRSSNPNFEVELEQPRREPGRVTYGMIVRLKPTAPNGYLHEELTLITDEQTNGAIPLTVEGRVHSALTVSPASLFLGELTPGQKVTKQLVVHGNRAFKIHAINSKLPGFECRVPGEARETHIVPVTITAGAAPGALDFPVEIETDLGRGVSQVTGQVKAPDAQVSSGK